MSSVWFTTSEQSACYLYNRFSEGKASCISHQLQASRRNWKTIRGLLKTFDVVLAPSISLSSERSATSCLSAP